MDYVITLRVSNMRRGSSMQMTERDVRAALLDAGEAARGGANNSLLGSDIAVVDVAEVTDENGDNVVS